MATPTDIALRAQRARDVLENDEFQRVFNELREKAVRQIELSPIGNVVDREKLCLTLAVLAKIKKEFEGSAKELQILEKKAENFNIKGEL